LALIRGGEKRSNTHEERKRRGLAGKNGIRAQAEVAVHGGGGEEGKNPPESYE